MKFRRGFTLVEILVVVLIMGITAAIAMPYVGTRNDQKVTSAARQIASDLIYVQNEAIASQTYYYIQFDTTHNEYFVLSALPSTTATQPVTKNPYLVSFGASGNSGLPDCSLGTVSFDGATVLGFDWLGAPYSVTNGVATPLTTGSILVNCGNSTQTIKVDAVTGQIEVN